MTHAFKPPAPFSAREMELTHAIGKQLAEAIRMRRNLVRLGLTDAQIKIAVYLKVEPTAAAKKPPESTAADHRTPHHHD